MREILFRGKRRNYNEWVYGNYCGAEYSVDRGLEHLIIPIPRNSSSAMVIPETVGQCTGLTDKNGKKIFEGDIVALGTIRTHEVKYNNGSFYMDGTAIPIRHIYKFEVIGNIHDNPELLKGGAGK